MTLDALSGGVSIRRVLFVCHGNINRSPAGELMLRRMVASSGLDLEIDSAGTNTANFRGGAVMAAAMRREMIGRGYSEAETKRRSKQLGPTLLGWADLVLYMDDKNERRILEISEGREPAARGPRGRRAPPVAAANGQVSRGSGVGGYFAKLLGAPAQARSHLTPRSQGGSGSPGSLVQPRTPTGQWTTGPLVEPGVLRPQADAATAPQTPRRESAISDAPSAPDAVARPRRPVRERMLRLSLLLSPPQPKIPDPHYDKTHERACDMLEESLEALLTQLGRLSRAPG